MIRRVTVSTKPGMTDSRGEGIRHDARDLGITAIEDVRVSDVYLFEGNLNDTDTARIADELLTDPVTQERAIDAIPPARGEVIEVAYNYGVMDPVEASLSKALRDLGITAVTAAKTMKRYDIAGSLTDTEKDLLTEKLLYNKIIQHVTTPDEEAFLHAKPVTDFTRVEVELLSLDNDGLMGLSRDRFLSMNLDEMKTLQAHYKKLDRNPTDIELETYAQTWSEHCVHKTFRGIINFNGEIIDNLLKSTIARATREIDHPMCVSVFVDNAGVIRFDDEDNVCFKVETHNFPSSLEPVSAV